MRAPALPHLLPWLVAAVAALAGAALLASSELKDRREAFDTNARIAHRLLSQRLVQHDAVLATLALLNSTRADQPEQRLPALYAQILRVTRREAGQAWPDADHAQAEERSRQLGHAAISALDNRSGQYDLVLAAGAGAYALRIDMAQTVPQDEWPLPPGRSPAQVALALPGQPAFALQTGQANGGNLGWPLHFDKVLASPSQPFHLLVSQRVGPSELPWMAMGAWCAAMVGMALAWTAWQRQLTRRRRAEDLLRLGQVTRLNTLGELAAGLAHELNQPLTAVVANTQASLRLLREQGDIDPTAVAAMEQAVAQARRAAEVVARLRRVIERPAQADGLPSVVLQDAVRDALHLLEPECQRRQVATSVEAPAHEVRVRADPVALEQIVHNLIMNALQAMEQMPVDQRRLTLRLGTEASLGRLDVIDTGPGLSPAVMAKLFQPFFSTRAGGLGLGLSLCDTLATGMGGRLSAQPHPSGGAAFCLTLPLATP